MAFLQNPDGTWVMTDDSGRGLPPITLPANVAPPAPAPPPPAPFVAPPRPNMVEPGQQTGPEPEYYIDPRTGVTIDLATMKPTSPSAALIPSVRPAPARSQTLTPPGPADAAPLQPLPPELGGAEGFLPLPPTPNAPLAPLPMEMGGEPPPSPSAAPLMAPEPFAAPPRLTEGAIAGPSLFGGGSPVSAKQQADAGLHPGAPQPGQVGLPTSQQYTGPSDVPIAGTPAVSPADIVTAGKASDDSAPLTADEVAKDPQRSLLASGINEEVERMTGKTGYIGPTPARDILKSWSVRRQAELSPERKQGMLGALEGRAMAIAHGGDVRAAPFEDAATLAERQAADARRQHADLIKRQAQEQGQLRQTMAPLNAEIDAIRTEAAVNPIERYYERKGAFSRIMGHIGLALMAGADALTGGNSMAVMAQKLRDEVNQEVDAQKMKLDAMGASVNARRGLLADLRATMMSPEAAETAARALLLEANAAELRKIAAIAGSAEARQAAIEQASALSVEAQGLMAEVEQKEGGEISLSGVHKPATAGGYARAPSKLDLAAKIAHKIGEKPLYVLQAMEDIEAGRTPSMPKGKMDRAQVQMMESVMNRAITLPNGSVVYAGDVTSKQKAEIKITYGNMMLDNLKEIHKIVSKGGNWESLPTESKARIQSIASQNGYLLKPILGEALSIGEVERLWGNLIGDHTTNLFSFASNNKAKLEQTIKGTQNLLDSELGRLHMDPWRPSPINKIITKVPTGAKKIE